MPFHAWNPARESDIARSTVKNVNALARSFPGAERADMSYGLFALSAGNDRILRLPKVLIQIHEILVTLWIRARHRLAAVIPLPFWNVYVFYTHRCDTPFF